MPFASKKQMRYLFAKHPKIAGKIVKAAKREHKPLIRRKKR